MFNAVRRGRLLSQAINIASESTSTSFRLQRQSAPWQRLSQTSTKLQAYRSFSSLRILRQQAAAQSEDVDTVQTPNQFTKFHELGDAGVISPLVIDTIVNKMKIHTMTEVQRMTLNECLDGTDVVAQARTGTGKTLAFLLPIVQRLLKDPDLNRRARGFERASIDDIRALIISPTRELAEQIAVEAGKIVAGTPVKVQTAVGGTQKNMHLQKMSREGCHVLVGTPGRINDILSDNYSGVKLDNIETFVLDEADRLLDVGFAPAIEEIQSYMPRRDVKSRQTMMFSATVPKEVVALVRKTLRPDFKFVRTVDPGEAPTHARIPQHVVFLEGLQNQLPALLETTVKALEAHVQDPTKNMPFKAIVYFSSTAEVALAHEVFQNLRAPGVTGTRDRFGSHPLDPCKLVQMHSKLTQQARTRNSDVFRRAETAILFSSDVTARGMDFPNVSHVIQFGLPRNSDDYVHRIGRTGRAGKSGEAWLFLTKGDQPFYRRYLGENGGMIKDYTGNIESAKLDMTRGGQLSAQLAKVMEMIEGGVKATPFTYKSDVYRALIGVLGSNRDKQATVDLMNDLARFGWGMEKPPGLSPTLIAKLGYSRCQGLEVSTRSEYEDRGNDRGDRFGGREGGRGGFGGGRGGFGGRSGGRDDRFGGGRGGNDPFGGRSRGDNDSFGGRSRGRDDSFGGRRGGRDDSFGGRGGGGGGDPWAGNLAPRGGRW